MKYNDKDDFVVLEQNSKFHVFQYAPIVKRWDKKLITENYSEVMTFFRSRLNASEPTVMVRTGITEGILPTVPPDYTPDTQDWGHGTTFTFSPKVTAFGNPIQKALGTVFNTLAMKSKVGKAIPAGSNYTLHAGARGTFNGKSEPSRSVTVHAALSPEDKQNIAASLAKEFAQEAVAHSDTNPVQGTSMAAPAPVEPAHGTAQPWHGLAEPKKEVAPEPELNWHNSFHESTEDSIPTVECKYCGENKRVGIEIHPSEGKCTDCQTTDRIPVGWENAKGTKNPNRVPYFNESLDKARKAALNENEPKKVLDGDGGNNPNNPAPSFDPNAPAVHLEPNQLAAIAGDIHKSGLDPHKRDPYTLLRHLSNSQANFLHGNPSKLASENSIGELFDHLYGSLGYPMQDEPDAKALNPDAAKLPNDKEIGSSLGIKIESYLRAKEKHMKKLQEALNEALTGGPLNAAGDGPATNIAGPGGNVSLMLASELMAGAAAFTHQIPTSDIFQPTVNQLFNQADAPKLSGLSNAHGTPTNMYEKLDVAHKMALGLPITEKK